MHLDWGGWFGQIYCGGGDTMLTGALIVIDAQKAYTRRDSSLYCRDAARTIQKINSLIALFKAAALPVIYVKHQHAADGSDLGRMYDFSGEPEDDFEFKEGSEDVEFDEALTVIPDSPILIKNRYSAFSNPSLHKLLNDGNVTKVVICGFMTNFCCESTARDAHDRNFFVDFVVDATGTPGTEKYSQKDVRDIVSDLLSAGFCLVKHTDELVR